MASPVIQARSESAQSTDTTSHTVSRPAGVAGRLTIIIFCYDGGSNVVVTPPEGYTSFDTQDNGTNIGVECFYHLDTGSEGTSLTFTTDDSEKSVHFAYQLSGAVDPATQPPEIVSPIAAATATPDPSAITPTGGSKDYTFIVGGCGAGEQVDDDTFVNSTSANYGNLIQKTSGTGGTAATNIMCGSFDRTATVSSENPGTFGVDQSVVWVLWTIAVHPAADNRAEVSWAEFEVPNVSNRAEVSWAEFELPQPDNRSEVSWAEFQVPNLDNRSEVSWAELEVPNLDNRSEVSWAEFEVPDLVVPDNRAEVSWAEVQVPNLDNRSEVSWAEFEVPDVAIPDNRAEVAWAEFEVPTPDNRSEVSWAEFEVPTPDNRAEVSWAEVQLPNPDNRAEVSWAEFEVPEFGAPAGGFIGNMIRKLRRH